VFAVLYFSLFGYISGRSTRDDPPQASLERPPDDKLVHMLLNKGMRIYIKMLCLRKILL